MSAAEARASLAAIGRDLLAGGGDRGARRAAALLRRRDDRAWPRPGFADLRAAPDWLRRPRDAQRRIALAAALASLGRTLAVSVDGSWLGRLAEAAGEDLVDWAIEAAPALPDCDAAPIPPDALEARGFALLRASLPPALRPYLGWAPGDVPVDCPAEAVSAVVAAAARRAA